MWTNAAVSALRGSIFLAAVCLVLPAALLKYLGVALSAGATGYLA